MANFKEGDRVRVARFTRSTTRNDPRLIGREGTIKRAYDGFFAGAYDWYVAVDGLPHPDKSIHSGDWWAFSSDELEPLTPPAEDTWAADKVKQVTRVYSEPEVAERKREFDRIVGA